MNWRKSVVWGLVAGTVVVGGAIGANRSDDSKNESPAPAAEKLAVASAKMGPIKQVVTATGKVASNLDVEIKCRASGEVIKLPFDISDRVKKGDLLLALDPKDVQRTVGQAEANLAAAQARCEQSKAALLTAEKQLAADQKSANATVFAMEARANDAGSKAERERQLLNKKFSSPEVVETAETSVIQAEQKLKTARAQLHTLKAQELKLETLRQQINVNKAQMDASRIALDLAKLQQSYCSIYSPIDGVVSTRTAQIGNIISSGMSASNGGTSVMVLSDLSHIYVLASVDESQIGFVQVGQAANVTGDSFNKTVFTGVVNRIGAKGVKVANVITFEVRIEITSENKTLLKPEMSADASIVVVDKPNVLQVPAYAVISKKEGDFVALHKTDSDDKNLQRVEVGASDGIATEIVSGLPEGTEVLVQDPEAEGHARNSDPSVDAARRRMMMMRTMGGGSMRMR